MNIGIDGQVLEKQGVFGIMVYTKNLLKHLAEIDSSNKYFIYSLKKIPIPKADNFVNVIIPPQIPIFKRQLIFPYLVKKVQKLDLFHFPTPESSLNISNIPSIITFHDPIPISPYLHNTYTFKQKCDFYYMNFFSLRNIQKAKIIICNSKSTNSHLKTYLSMHGISDKVLTHIPLSHASKFKFRNKKHHKRSGLICMADKYKRKNTKKIIAAFSIFKESHNSDKHSLQIISSGGTNDKELVMLIKKLNLEKSVKIVKSPKLNNLVSIYNNSSALIYPSLFEGFGIPILESFACGCPVITSNYGATKETAGKCALLVNPNSTEQIAQAILAITSNTKLTDKLRQCGLKRASEFSWTKTAEQTLKVYEKTQKI